MTAQTIPRLPVNHPPAPLVEPGPPLSASDTDRYSRHIMLPQLHVLGQRRINNARVLVVGAGGLGSPILLYLAAAGIGTLGLIDDDEVEISNLQRQIIHTTMNVGRSKVSSARDAIHAINPCVNVIEHQCRLTTANALQLFDDYDLVVDGADNFATRYLISDAATILGKPCIWGSLLRFGAQVSVFWNTHGPTYRDLYPEPPAPGTVPSCSDAGVLGMLCGVAGALMATETVKIITGIGNPLIGRIAQLDALQAGWQELRLVKDPQTRPVTALSDYEQLCGIIDDGEIAVDQITPRELDALLKQRDSGSTVFEFLDVREEWEHDAYPIPGSRLVPLDLLTRLPELAGINTHVPIIVHCQSGLRSEKAARILAVAGYSNVRSLTGGAAAWPAETHVGGL